MKSITIHGIDESLDQCLREKAMKSQKSMNKTIKEILEGALGLNVKKKIDRRKGFMDLYGVWTDKEEAEFNKAIKDCEKINGKDWK